MNEPTGAPSKRGPIARVWAVAMRPSARFSLLTLLVIGAIGGVLFWGAFNWSMELTNTEAFCISCHEMRDTVYKELKETVHFTNRTGVRAICSGCHVPAASSSKKAGQRAVGNKDKLIPTIETVIAAVQAGELDTNLAHMSKTAVLAKGKRAG